MAEEPKLSLLSKEKKVIVVSQELLKHGEFFKNLMADVKPDDKIELDFSEKIINYMVEFLEHYKGKEFPAIVRPIRGTLKEACKDEWLFTFLSKPIEEISQIIELGNFVMIPPLFDAASGAFAAKIIGKTTEELRKEFGVECDLTNDDNQKIDEFFDWVPELFGVK